MIIVPCRVVSYHQQQEEQQPQQNIIDSAIITSSMTSSSVIVVVDLCYISQVGGIYYATRRADMVERPIQKESEWHPKRQFRHCSSCFADALSIRLLHEGVLPM